MGINNKHLHGYNPMKVIIAIMIALGFILTDLLLQSVVEESKRNQARLNLEQIHHCYNKTINEFSKDKVYNICTSKSKTSFTGDVYVLELIDTPDRGSVFTFAYETSNDTDREENLLFTKDSVGKHFVDWESAKKALDIIKLGKDSYKGVNAEYNFDGGIEWLEWKYLPDDTGDDDIVVVQGTQQDEVMAEYSTYRMLGFGSVLLVVCTLLVANSVAIRRQTNGRIA